MIRFKYILAISLLMLLAMTLFEVHHIPVWKSISGGACLGAMMGLYNDYKNK
jgi:hypothetical protein